MPNLFRGKTANNKLGHQLLRQLKLASEVNNIVPVIIVLLRKIPYGKIGCISTGNFLVTLHIVLCLHWDRYL